MIGVSINDLRKNLRDLNEYMDVECKSTAARYGLVLDAHSSLASIRRRMSNPPWRPSTPPNQVSSDISLAQASADQKIEQSKRAVEIETLKAQAEVQPIKLLAEELSSLHKAGEAVSRRLSAECPAEGFTRSRCGLSGGTPMNTLMVILITFLSLWINRARVPGVDAPLWLVRHRARAHLPRLRFIRKGHRHAHRTRFTFSTGRNRRGGVHH